MGSERAVAALEAAEIDYVIERYGPVASLAESAEVRGIRASQILKTLVVRRGDDDFVFVLVPGDRQISWPKLRALLGVARLSMPNAEVARDVTGYVRGTITPFGALHAWPVIADSRVLYPEPDLSGEIPAVLPGDSGDIDPSAGSMVPDGSKVSIGAGEPGVSAMIGRSDLVRVLDAVVADVTGPLESSS